MASRRRDCGKREQGRGWPDVNDPRGWRRRRDPARVLDDVRAGPVSVEAARRDYGVEVDVAAETARRVPCREPAALA